MPVRRQLLVATIALLFVTALLPESAGATTGNGRSVTFLGNLVSSKVLDRITVGHNEVACTITVEPGRGGGKYGAPIAIPYVVPAIAGRSVAACPDMGVTVAAHRLYDDLVVTWSSAPPGVADSLVILRNLRVIATAPGEDAPSRIGSQDFNGDGLGDVWETSSDGGGFTTYLRSGTSLVAGPATFPNQLATPSLAFGAIDNVPGTDIVSSFLFTNDGPTVSGVAVVSGASGAMSVLTYDSTGTSRYTVALLDANHDGITDIQISTDGGPPQLWIGDGVGGFHH